MNTLLRGLINLLDLYNLNATFPADIISGLGDILL